jgi:hypothetical protein
MGYLCQRRCSSLQAEKGLKNELARSTEEPANIAIEQGVELARNTEESAVPCHQSSVDAGRSCAQ